MWLKTSSVLDRYGSPADVKNKAALFVAEY